MKEESGENCCNPEICLICSAPTSTLHYQIIICYACAAFYRRSTKVYHTYVCQRNDGKCNIVYRKTGKPMCRFCRYQKCLKVGINPSKSLENRENKDAKEVKNFKKEVPKNLPESKYANLEAFEILYEKVVKILEYQPKLSSSKASPNYFEDFNKLLRNFMEEMKPKQPLVLIKNDDIRLEFIAEFYLKAAKMLSKFFPFASLPLSEKITLFHAFWQNFQLLERSFQGSKYFGNDAKDFRMPLDHFQYYDISTPEAHFMQFVNFKPYIIFLQPLFDRGKQFHEFFKKTKIADFEFCYICLFQLWNQIELPDLPDSTHELGNKIIAQASDELHNFYLEEFRMPAYAARQAQLFKLIHMIEIFNRERQKMITAKGIFDFSKDNFPYCRFELNYYNFINKHR